MDELVAGQGRQIGHGRVGCVEEAQLHRLKRLHVVRYHDVKALDREALAAEAILQHPEQERLGHHGPPVRDAHLRLQPRPVGVGGAGRDAIDHAVGKCDVGVDPGRQLDTNTGGLAQRGRPADPAVGLDVVEAHDGQRACPAPAPEIQPSSENAEGRPGAGDWRRRIVGPTGVVDRIAAFGDRHADDLRIRRGDSVDERTGVGMGVDVVDQAADDRDRVLLLATDHEAVEVILGRQGLCDRGVGRQHTGTDDRP